MQQLFRVWGRNSTCRREGNKVFQETKLLPKKIDYDDEINKMKIPDGKIKPTDFGDVFGGVFGGVVKHHEKEEEDNSFLGGSAMISR